MSEQSCLTDRSLANRDCIMKRLRSLNGRSKCKETPTVKLYIDNDGATDNTAATAAAACIGLCDG